MKHKTTLIIWFWMVGVSFVLASENKPLNLTVLLDLSDRVLYPNQINKDKQILDTLFSVFETEVRNNLFIKSDDRLSIVVAKQKQKSTDIEKLSFNIALDKYGPHEKKKQFKLKKDEFRSSVKEIYLKCQHSKNKKDYFGSDVWSFMKYEYPNSYKNGYRNVLVILTDGYLYFESDVKRPAPKKNRYYSMSFLPTLRKHNFLEVMKKTDIGLQTTNTQYPELQVLLLEVNPKNELFVDEQSLLQTVWEKWFKEMGAINCQIITKQSIEIVQEKIENACK